MRTSIDELVQKLRAGDVRVLAGALRLVDDRQNGYVDLLKRLYLHTGRAYVLGITGTPGAGKSTLIEALVRELRKRGSTVAVLAVDPSSSYTGGAILGDRIRMQRHFLDPGVFIRSLATRGYLGGLSRSTSDMVHVLDAAGFDVVIVETVGVGQDELDIIRLAHTVVVVLSPGLGDDVQALKAGVLEIADVFVVNKADREGADATVRDLEQMLHLGIRQTQSEWEKPVIKTIAVQGKGLAEVVSACDRHRSTHAAPDDSRALGRASQELLLIVRDELYRHADQALQSIKDSLTLAIARRETDPYTAGEQLLNRLKRKTEEHHDT